ncbi:MAG TPA: Na+:solute symporter [Thermoplasmata archaeon]|nr:Na+:solute symporter [Thermoplasmata archaeon]
MIELHPVDWFIIIWYLLVCTFVGLYYSKVASKRMEEYFVAGRSLPWWITGTSMVATTFAADTPLAVTALTAQHGIAGNWFWWSFMFGGMLTAIFYAKLWRRSEVLTDMEFAELRYSGKPAAALRGFRSLYTGIFINAIIMGWVMLAMAKIFSVVLGWPTVSSTILAAVIALAYTLLAGLWGVTMTDVVQFILAMLGCVVLAVFALAHVGWIDGLHAGLVSTYGQARTSEILSFAPSLTSIWMPFAMFLTYLTLNWYSSWYPGAEPGGGGYIAQRMLSCKTEKDSKLSMIWFTFAHYVLRPWPWIIVALVSMVVWPNLADPELGYPLAMGTFLPVGLRGLIIAAFLAAFMSTMSTQINWGSSYIVRDFYQRFIKKDAPPKHYVNVARGVSALQLGLAILISFVFPSVADAWKFLIVIGAGTGLVYLLRWFWWRVNAWSEISAMCSAMVIGLSVTHLTSDWVIQMWVTFISVTSIWLAVTFLTKPEEERTLDHFYKKVHPGGFWNQVRARTGVKGDRITARDWIGWAVGCLFILTGLMGTGYLVLGQFLTGVPLLATSIVSFVVLYTLIIKSNSE